MEITFTSVKMLQIVFWLFWNIMDIFLITCVKQWGFTNIKMLDFMEATFSHLEPDITHTNNNINMVILGCSKY